MQNVCLLLFSVRSLTVKLANNCIMYPLLQAQYSNFQIFWSSFCIPPLDVLSEQMKIVIQDCQ